MISSLHGKCHISEHIEKSPLTPSFPCSVSPSNLQMIPQDTCYQLIYRTVRSWHNKESTNQPLCHIFRYGSISKADLFNQIKRHFTQIKILSPSVRTWSRIVMSFGLVLICKLPSRSVFSTHKPS